MKILIIGLAKIKYMPYLNFYLDSIDYSRNEVHVCYWNRDGKPEDLSNYTDIRFHEFIFEQFNSVKKRQKIKPFWLYRGFILKVMKAEKFDFVIFLHSLSGVLIADKLKKGKYIFDYRDSTYETNVLFRHLIHILVKKSYTTFVSSEGFLKYLPDAKNIYISHNLVLDSLSHRTSQKERCDKIRICFWGYIRNVSVNKLIIEKISKDKRFELHYYGREQYDALELKKYSTGLSADNVYFHGEYQPEERYDFQKCTDLIHNIYDDRNMRIAMGNKYYDGIIFGIPQICMPGSFMGMQVEKKSIGIALSPEDDAFSDKIYRYYTELNPEKFRLDCETELNRSLNQFKLGQDIIKELGK